MLCLATGKRQSGTGYRLFARRLLWMLGRARIERQHVGVREMKIVVSVPRPIWNVYHLVEDCLLPLGRG